MVLFGLLITLAYLVLIGSFVYGFDKLNPFKLYDVPSETKFSIIIPFRNEAENLPNLLKSASSLAYPNHLFEIIFVDDASEDDSVGIIKKRIETSKLDIIVISNKRTSNSPKKDAITLAISHANHEWILTTDADCILPKYWLDSFDAYIQKTNASCIVAPVAYQITSGFLNRFQCLDMLSLQGATMGGFGIQKPFLCSGANFGYKKVLFDTLNGFDGNTDIASGDDIFFLEKAINKHPNHVHYLKSEEAIVTTITQPTWRQLIAQRIRWAAKTTSYNNWFGKLTGFIVFAMNAMVIANILLVILSIIPPKTLIYILFIKFNIDFLLIYKTASFVNQKDVLFSFLFSFILYPFFSVYCAFMSIFKSYNWKGRTYKK